MQTSFNIKILLHDIFNALNLEQFYDKFQCTIHSAHLTMPKKDLDL